MTLDPTTGLIFLLAVTAASGLTALTLWRLHPELHGLGIVALGSLLTGPTFATVLMHGPHGITAHNMLVIACETTVTEGLLVFLGYRPNVRFVVGLTLLTGVLWEIMLAFDPNAVPLRVVAITLLSVVIFGRGIALMLRLRRQRPMDPAEIMMAGTLSVHMVVLVARMVATLLHPDPGFARSAAMQGWFFLELSVLNVLLFFSVLMMVGSRLARDLRRQNLAVATERHLKSELRQLLHMLGHELRMPLSIVGRAIDTLHTLLASPSAEVDRQLATLRTTVERIDRLTETLLTAERTSMVSARPEPLDLARIVAEATAMLEDKWGGGRLRLELADGAPQVLGDRDLLFTAALNLLDNALKYSPPDTAVAAALQCRDDEVALRVTDRGIGFPADQLARIGQRFFRASNAQTVAGTGLGLYMVKTIAQRHGGRLELDNGPEGGAVVTLILPAT